jgi:hypothetical protein
MTLEALLAQAAQFNPPETPTENLICRLASALEHLSAECEFWNADARKLSGGLLAIHGAAETVPASVLRGIAYDVALNCMDPQTAHSQIAIRAKAG